MRSSKQHARAELFAFCAEGPSFDLTFAPGAEGLSPVHKQQVERFLRTRYRLWTGVWMKSRLLALHPDCEEQIEAAYRRAESRT